MTHDLLRNVIIACGLSPSKVIVTDLLENTFYAQIELFDSNGALMTLDSRPSDAIALALRLDCPIYVEQKVLDLSATSTQVEAEADEGSHAAEDWPDLIG
jgi:bifunctional DNase/RNase